MDELDGVPQEAAIIELGTNLSRAGDVEITVRDHGNGLPEPQLPQLFEAFFTTKSQGLGLGLTIVRSIVEYHNGSVTAENHPAGGFVSNEHSDGISWRNQQTFRGRNDMSKDAPAIVHIIDDDESLRTALGRL